MAPTSEAVPEVSSVVYEAFHIPFDRFLAFCVDGKQGRKGYLTLQQLSRSEEY